MHKKEKLLVSLSPYLKGKVESFSEKYGCSQAEVARIALMKLLEAEK